MAEPIREQILAAVKARAEGITVAAGYRETVLRVTRALEYLDQQNELPILIVLPANEENEKRYDELGDGLIDATMGVEVVLFAEGTSSVGLSTTIERLVADVEQALTTPDLRLGLTAIGVYDVQDTGRFSIEYIASADWLRGAAAVVYRIAYSYARGAP
mgnify:CR=1 FL=1